MQIVVTDDAGYCRSPCGQHNVIGYGRDSVGHAYRVILLTAHIAGYALPEGRFGSVVLSGLWKGCEVTPTS